MNIDEQTTVTEPQTFYSTDAYGETELLTQSNLSTDYASQLTAQTDLFASSEVVSFSSLTNETDQYNTLMTTSPIRSNQ
ncbi:unnamed protein product [Heterobilharzia americana]|nr:unnamed protein product [Heterobilharzia americana]